MSTEPSLNEFAETPRRNRMSRLVIASWLCLLWVGIAFCVLYGMLAHNLIDIKGRESSPFDLLFSVVLITGLIAIPVGFTCGLCALLFRKDPEFVSFLPTLALGLLLVILTCLQCQMYHEDQRNQQNANTPFVVPVVPIE